MTKLQQTAARIREILPEATEEQVNGLAEIIIASYPEERNEDES
jgi:hypothetical protein